MEKRKFSRRDFLKIGSAGLLVAAMGDQLAGLAYEELFMSGLPQAEAVINPRSKRTIIVAGGEGNDGIDVARGMRPYLFPICSVVGIRYAQTNVSPQPLTSIINQTLEHFSLQDNLIDMYCNSAAGIIMAEPMKQLSRRKKLGTVILDGSPHNAADIEGMLGDFDRDHLDLIDHSRVLTLLTRIYSGFVMPPAFDKAPEVTLSNSEADRAAEVNADGITLGMEAEAIRKGINPNSLIGVAENFVYMHSHGEDPVINNATAFKGWGAACGFVRDVTDPFRPANTHACGDTYPLGVAKVLSGSL